MDLFPAQGRVSPVQAPQESPAIRSFLQGLQAGKSIPTPATAIADAVTQGIQSYDAEVQTKQQIAAKDIALQSAQMDLAAKQELQPEALENQKAALAVERDKLAEETRLRQDRDELFSVLEEGDPGRVSEAVLTNKYARVFAADPKLEEVATKRAADFMTPSQKQALLKQKDGTALSNMLARQQLANDAKHKANEDKYFQSSFLDSVLSNNPGLDARTFARDVEFVPSGSVEIDPNTGMVVVDPKTHKYKRPEGYDPQVKNNNLPNTWVGISKRGANAGKVYVEAVTAKDKELVDGYRGSAINASNSDLRDSGPAAAIRQALGQTPGVTESREPGGGTVPNTVGGKSTLSAANVLQPKAGAAQQTGPIDIANLKTEVSKVQLVDSSGKPDLNKPVIGDLYTRSLSLTPKVAAKYRGALGNYLGATTAPNRVVGGLNTKIYSDSVRRQEKDRLVRNILSDEFEEKDTPEYTYERVKVHNELADSLPVRIAAGDPIAAAMALTPAATRVSSPQELYVLDNYGRMWSRMGFAAKQIHEAGVSQQQEIARKGLTRNSVLANSVIKVK